MFDCSVSNFDDVCYCSVYYCYGLSVIHLNQHILKSYLSGDSTVLCGCQ